MEIRVLFFCLSVVLITFSSGCFDSSKDSGNDDEGTMLERSYTGTLTLTYSKDFPSFSATSSMTVNITREGEVRIGPAQPALWDADEIKELDDGKIRQRDCGSLSIDSGSSVVIVRGSDEYAALDVHATITGEQETFAWNEETMTWMTMANVPYNLEDPMTPPLEFDIAKATTPLTGDSKRATADQGVGSVNYEWMLILIPGII